MWDVSAENNGVVNCDSIWWSLSNVGVEIGLYTRVSLISVVSLHQENAIIHDVCNGSIFITWNNFVY